MRKKAPATKATTSAEDDFYPDTPTKQTANKSGQNTIMAASEESGKNYQSRTIIYHRDRTVTLWDSFTQAWVRTANPSDQLLGGLPRAEIDRIQRYVLNGISTLTVR